MLEIAYWITQSLLSIAALCAVYRVYKGPSVLDRVISVDVILIVVGSFMLADMAFGRHQDYILFVVVTAVIGFLGAVAIARYAAAGPAEAGESSQRAQASAATASINDSGLEPETPNSSPTDPAAPVKEEQREDESTSWFTALAKSGFVPQKKEDKE